FSSRRRHTRFSRDWSSDVCSSDLSMVAGTNANIGDCSSSSERSTKLTLSAIRFNRLSIDLSVLLLAIAVSEGRSKAVDAENATWAQNILLTTTAETFFNTMLVLWYVYAYISPCSYIGYLE